MRINKIKIQNLELTIPKVRLIARLKADGCVMRTGRKHRTNYELKYEAADYVEIQSFAEDIKEVYGLEPKFTMHRSGKNPKKLLPVVFVRSKLAYENIMDYGPFGSYDWNVPNDILEGNIVNRLEFIRVFAEDEGTIANREVRIYSINSLGLEKISSMLQNLGIKNRIRGGYGANKNIWAIIISRKENLVFFATLIGFRSKIKNDKLSKLLSFFK